MTISFRWYYCNGCGDEVPAEPFFKLGGARRGAKGMNLRLCPTCVEKLGKVFKR
jgi:hypothetical protein